MSISEGCLTHQPVKDILELIACILELVKKQVPAPLKPSLTGLVSGRNLQNEYDLLLYGEAVISDDAPVAAMEYLLSQRPEEMYKQPIAGTTEATWAAAHIADYHLLRVDRAIEFISLTV